MTGVTLCMNNIIAYKFGWSSFDRSASLPAQYTCFTAFTSETLEQVQIIQQSNHDCLGMQLRTQRVISSSHGQ